MNEEKEETIENLKKSLSDLMTSKKVELVDILLKPSRQGRLLIRFLVDKPQGIRMGECAELNELMGDIIDKENIMTQSYILEVSSPGLDRLLKTKRDFERVKNKLIIAHIRIQPQGTEKITGRVIDVDEEKVILDVNGQRQNILLNEIHKATLKIDLKKGEVK